MDLPEGDLPTLTSEVTDDDAPSSSLAHEEPTESKVSLETGSTATKAKKKGWSWKGVGKGFSKTGKNVQKNLGKAAKALDPLHVAHAKTKSGSSHGSASVAK